MAAVAAPARAQSATSNAPACEQAKKLGGRSAETYEREADRVADAVMRMPGMPPEAPPLRPSAGAPPVQRRCAKCEGEECSCAQKKPVGLAPPTATVDVSAFAGGGQPLASETRQFFEPRFGYDFSRVRVHSDSQAAASSRAINAEAYTVGNNIVFGEGRYDPRGHAGRNLLAHELAHVVQQSGAAPTIQRKSRGPGGCGFLDALAATTIGSLAHTQIQGVLAGRGYRTELPIARASKANKAIFSLGCPDATVNTGFVDVAMIAGSTVGISEIKPYYLTPLAEAETLHYIRRGYQSKDRITRTGACAGTGPDLQDAYSSAQIGGITAATNFAAAAGVISGTETFGPFVQEPTHLLKAKEVAPGAIGYWCTKIPNPKEEDEEEENEEEKDKESEKESEKEGQENETADDDTSAENEAERVKREDAEKGEKSEKSDKETEEGEGEKPTDEPVEGEKPPVEGEKPPVEGEPVKPEAPAGAGAANVGFGISIFSMNFGAFNAGVGVSVFSISGGLGTAGAGVSWFSNSLGAGSVGAGVAIDNNSAGALTAGAGLAEDSNSAGAVTAGAGEIDKSNSAAAVAAGAGKVDNSTTSGAVVAGHGTMSGVSGSASVTTGSGDIKDVKGGDGDKPADPKADPKADANKTDAPAGTNQGSGGTGTTGAPGAKGQGTGTTGTTAGAPGGTTATPGATAGTPGGTTATPGATPGTPGGTADTPGATTGTPGGTPATPDQLAVAAIFPANASQADKDKIIADAKKVAELLQASSDSQKELMKYLASQETDGKYMISTTDWISKLLEATKGMTPEDILYLEQLHWVPGHLSPEELRKKLQEALAKRPKGAASATPKASGAGNKGDKAGATGGPASGDASGADNKGAEALKAADADKVTAPPAGYNRKQAGVFPFQIMSGMSQFGSYTKGQSISCSIRVKDKGKIFVLHGVSITFDHRSDVPANAASGKEVETTFWVYFTQDFWSDKHKLYGLGGADTVSDYGWGRHKKP